MLSGEGQSTFRRISPPSSGSNSQTNQDTCRNRGEPQSRHNYFSTRNILRRSVKYDNVSLLDGHLSWVISWGAHVHEWINELVSLGISFINRQRVVAEIQTVQLNATQRCPQWADCVLHVAYIHWGWYRAIGVSIWRERGSHCFLLYCYICVCAFWGVSTLT